MCKNEFKSQMKDASVGVLLVFDRDDRQKENKYDRDGLHVTCTVV